MKTFYVESHFLDKYEELYIHHTLEKSTPYDIYINNEIYRKQATFSKGIPLLIPKDELDLGYNEIYIDARDKTTIGITKGGDKESNIIKYSNCNINGTKLYVNGNAEISVIANNIRGMNKVLKINDIFKNTTQERIIERKDIIRIDNNKIINNVSAVNHYANNIMNYKYFKIRFKNEENSKIYYCKPLDINGKEFDITNKQLGINTHNLKSIDDAFLYSGDNTIPEIDYNKKYTEIEFTSSEIISGFNIHYENISSVEIHGVKTMIDSYDLITTFISNDNSLKTSTIFKDNYISSILIEDTFYILGNDGQIVPYTGDIKNLDAPRLPVIPDDIVSKIISDDKESSIGIHKDISTLVLKKDIDIDYGVYIKKGDLYLDNATGVLSETPILYDISKLDYSTIDSDMKIIYRVNSLYPIILYINPTIYVSYKIENTIEINSYDITPETIHDEYFLIKINSSNEFGLKATAKFIINNKVADEVMFNSGRDIQKAYDYNSNHIKLGMNDIVVDIEDTLGYKKKSDTIQLNFDNSRPSITSKVSDFGITCTISDNDGDLVKHTILINGEPVDYNNPFREPPYSFYFEYPTDYIPGTSIKVTIQAMDILNGSTASNINHRVIDRGILILNSNSIPATNQDKEQILDLHIGRIISNQSPEPFLFKIKNQTGFDLKDISVFLDKYESDPEEVILEIGTGKKGESIIYKENFIVIDSLKYNEVINIYVKVNGKNIESGKLGSIATIRVDAKLI